MASRPDREKTANKLKLQLSLLQATIKKLEEPAKQAIKVLNEYYSSADSGPGPLDFEYRQVNNSLDPRNKFELEGENVEYLEYSPLMVAVLTNPELARVLIEEGAAVAFKNKEGLTALHVACNAGNLEMVDLLLRTSLEQRRFVKKKRLSNDCQVFINTKVRPKGWTPLMYAVKNGHIDIVKRMMECEHLDCSVTNRKKQNVFHIAAREGHLHTMEPLWSVREKRDDIIAALKSSDFKNWNVLHQLCTQEHVEDVKWLLEEFRELKNKEFLEQISKVGYTPFLVACEYHKSDIVKYFLELHKEGLIDISAKCHKDGDRGTTALHLAAIHNNKDLAALLVEAGCPLDISDEKGNNILHVSMAKGNRRVAKFISDVCEKKGIDLESKTNDDEKHPKEVEEEITIPPEITRLGKEAVAAYEKALEEGKRKIPYCGMLILGDSGVGKTSLYRQLVGLKFRDDLRSTEGIDNNTIDTMVDERSIAVQRKSGNTWHETDVSTGETFAKAAGEETRKLMPKKAEKRHKSNFPSEAKLLQVIKEIKEKLEPPDAAPFIDPSFDEMHLIQFLRDNIRRNPNPPSKPPSQESRNAGVPKAPTVDQPKILPEEPKPKPISKVSTKPREEIDLPTPPAQPDKPVLPDEPRQPPPKRPAREPVRKEEPRRQREMHITRRDSSIIAGVAKGRTKHDSQEQLTLITKDFAGQPQYRPMHHCFITRRACYLVVFKLPDMVEVIANSGNPQSNTNAWEELIYWVHSINAHIYPPDEEEKRELNKCRRIILVGTHRNKVSGEKVNDVDEFIKKKINKDMRSVNHVSTELGNKAASSTPSESEPTPNCFIAVENSIDIMKRSVEYLSESGTKKVQQAIERISNTFRFLKEEYPIKWLKFKERIEITATSTPVVKIQDLKEMATSSRIFEEEQQSLAIRFLHDSGKIICLDQLPHLFLSDGELEELKGNIVIRPQWLISLMKKIMFLNLCSDCIGIDKTLVVKLQNSGEADLILLEECWKDILKEQDIMSLRQLCLLLKAYCLIFPLNKEQEDEIENPSSNGAADADDSRENGETNSKKDFKYFLVPSMLPKEHEEFDRIPEKNWSRFYFDFKGFLPAEVYHRLLCKLLTETDSDSEEFFSRNECIIDSEEIAWRIRWKEFDHVLEVSVVGIESLEKGMNKLHNDLSKICCDSRLGGLTYRGGVVGIDCSSCKEKLYYVKFSEGKPSPNTKCRVCKNIITEDQQLSKVSIRENPSGEKSEASRSVDSKQLSIANLKEVNRECLKAATNWDSIGLELDVAPDILETISEDNKSNVRKCLLELLKHWLHNSDNRNWKVLAEVMGSEAVGRKDIGDHIFKKYL